MNKLTKSFFGLLLGTTFCFGLIAGLNANKADNPVETKADTNDNCFLDNFVIYVDKTSVDWMDLHIYHTTNGISSYSPMDLVAGNIYKCEIPSNTTKFLVNHGAQDYGGNCRTAEITPTSIENGDGFNNLIKLGSQATPIPVTYDFYVEATTTSWYLTGEFNNWDKADPKCHLTYGSHQGNNEQYDSDYAITIKKGTKFNFVYSWDHSHAYTYAPDLQGDVSTSNFTKTSDYFTANSDLVVKFYFQVWYNNNKPGWTGLYSYIYSADSEYEDDFKVCLESWAYDFVELTGDICDGTGRNNEAALKAIWNDSSLKTTTSSWCVAGDFTDWATNKIPMYETTTTNVCKLTDVYIIDSHGFKVTNGSNWYPGSNVFPGSTGYYTITFNTSTHDVSYEKQSKQYLKSSYNDLFASAKSQFTSTNSNPKTAIAYQRYAHIVNRYSSLDNFANISVSRSSSLVIAALGVGNNSSLIIIVIIASLGILTAGAYYFFKKSRKSEE